MSFRKRTQPGAGSSRRAQLHRFPDREDDDAPARPVFWLRPPRRLPALAVAHLSRYFRPLQQHVCPGFAPGSRSPSRFLWFCSQPALAVALPGILLATAGQLKLLAAGGIKDSGCDGRRHQFADYTKPRFEPWPSRRRSVHASGRRPGSRQAKKRDFRFPKSGNCIFWLAWRPSFRNATCWRLYTEVSRWIARHGVGCVCSVKPASNEKCAAYRAARR